MTAVSSEVRLADCVDLLAGFAFKSDRFEDSSGGGVPLVKGENVGQGRIHWDLSRYWPAAESVGLEKFGLQAGDVVLAMDRPWVPAGLKWAVIRENDPAALLVQRCARLRTRVSHLRQDFLRYVIGGPGFEAYIRPITTGVNVPHISGAQILAYSFRLPPLEEQKRIAGILSAYDDLIENCERRIRVLDEMARSLYREWFGIGSCTARGRFADVATIFRDSVDPRRCPEEEFAHFSIPAFDAGRRPAIEHGGSIQSVKTALPQGCVLLSKLNPRIPRVWIPQWSPTRRAIASTEFLVLQGLGDRSTSFLYCLCSSSEFMGAFASMAIGTSTSHQRVKPESLLQMDVPVPTESAIREFDAAVAPQLELSEALRERVTNLRATRDLLLPRLLSGQLSVDDAA